MLMCGEGAGRFHPACRLWTITVYNEAVVCEYNTYSKIEFENATLLKYHNNTN
jgi:hypothetical protein